jgi:hypothetical protein
LKQSLLLAVILSLEYYAGIPKYNYRNLSALPYSALLILTLEHESRAMELIPVLLLVLYLAIVVLVVGILFGEPLFLRIRRHLPNAWSDDESVLLTGLMLSAAFMFGLVVMYLLVKL